MARFGSVGRAPHLPSCTVHGTKGTREWLVDGMGCKGRAHSSAVAPGPGGGELLLCESPAQCSLPAHVPTPPHPTPHPVPAHVSPPTPAPSSVPAARGAALVHSMTNKTATSLHWSPAGRFLLLAGLTVSLAALLPAQRQAAAALLEACMQLPHSPRGQKTAPA